MCRKEREQKGPSSYARAVPRVMPIASLARTRAQVCMRACVHACVGGCVGACMRGCVVRRRYKQQQGAQLLRFGEAFSHVEEEEDCDRGGANGSGKREMIRRGRLVSEQSD
eukprot:3171158-Pleurochrysis_carterae.AAC.2